MKYKNQIIFFGSALVLYLVLYLFDIYFTKQIKNKVFEKPSWVINMKNEHFNVGFIGSSRVYNMVNIDSIEKKTGYRALNMGSGGASLMENYFTLKFYLDNNKIDNLYLEVDPFNLIDMRKAFSYPFREYIFFGNMNDEELKEAIKINNGYFKYYFWKYIPFVRYAEFSNAFASHYLTDPFFKKTNKDETEVFANSKGTVLLKGMTMPDSLLEKSKKLKKGIYPVDKMSLYYLNKIIDLAEKNKINLVLYKAPIYSVYYEKTEAGKEAIPCIDSVSKSRNLKFDDFQKVGFSSNYLKFKDFSHLNEDGTNLFSAILADSIIKRKNN